MKTSSSSNNELPKTKGRNIIRGGDGKILYEYDNDQNRKSSNVIRSGDGKRIFFSSKDKNKE